MDFRLLASVSSTVLGSPTPSRAGRCFSSQSMGQFAFLGWIWPVHPMEGGLGFSEKNKRDSYLLLTAGRELSTFRFSFASLP